jgi:predicted DNA binding CopG/RHH family protein
MPRNPGRKRFANQAEEAAWWEANERPVIAAFEKAVNQNYSGPCTVVVTGDSTVTRIRLGSRDVRRAREQSGKRGLRFHEYLKTLIHDSLRKPKKKRRSVAAKKKSRRRRTQ